MLNRFYVSYKLKIIYKQDEKALVVHVKINKPEKRLSPDERAALDNVIEHFSRRDYCVIVED